MDDTPEFDGYHRLDKPFTLFDELPGGLPPIAMCENVRIHNDIQAFGALLRYSNLPRPVAMLQHGDTGGKSTDYYAVITGVGMPEIRGCRLVMEEDTPLYVMHGTDCPRSTAFRQALLTGKPPAVDGESCPLDAAFQYARITGDFRPIPTAPMFDPADYDD